MADGKHFGAEGPRVVGRTLIDGMRHAVIGAVAQVRHSQLNIAPTAPNMNLHPIHRLIKSLGPITRSGSIATIQLSKQIIPLASNPFSDLLGIILDRGTRYVDATHRLQFVRSQLERQVTAKASH